MSVLLQLFLIFGICLLSELAAAALPFACPASIIGMVAILVLLMTGVLKPRHLQETSGFLLSHMIMFFIPACTSVITYADVLLQNLWSILLICVVTTPLVFFVTGQVVQLTMKWVRRREAQRHG